MNTCSFMMKLIELTKPPSRSGEYHFGMLMAKKLTAFFSITQTIIDNFFGYRFLCFSNLKVLGNKEWENYVNSE